jgi:flagellar biosynthesis protein FliP
VESDSLGILNKKLFMTLEDFLRNFMINNTLHKGVQNFAKESNKSSQRRKSIIHGV